MPEKKAGARAGIEVFRSGIVRFRPRA